MIGDFLMTNSSRCHCGVNCCSDALPSRTTFGIFHVVLSYCAGDSTTEQDRTQSQTEMKQDALRSYNMYRSDSKWIIC